MLTTQYDEDMTLQRFDCLRDLVVKLEHRQTSCQMAVCQVMTALGRHVPWRLSLRLWPAISKCG